jgi:S-DNA-T family DNA segregation ATPase FtsK/SpoIIIE
MKYLGPTQYSRLNEAVAVVFLAIGLFLIFSFASYQPFDPSWNTSTGATVKAVNLTGNVGAILSDFFLQSMGVGAYALPLLMFLMGWQWVRSEAISSPTVKMIGAAVLLAATCTLLGMPSGWHPIAGAIPAGGILGSALADYLTGAMNTTGALLVTVACWVVSLYLISKFEMARLIQWIAAVLRGPIALLRRISSRWSAWRESRAVLAKQRAEKRALRRALAQNEAAQATSESAAETEIKPSRRGVRRHLVPESGPPPLPGYPPIVDPLAPLARTAAVGGPPPLPPSIEDIPIRELAPPEPEPFAPPADPELLAEHRAAKLAPPVKQRTNFRLPPTHLLQEPQERSAYDSQELKEIAARIKAKFEEFNVHGNVVQINPGPVVTTFEFKPEAGVKYTRITALTEDLCLGLQAESILIERIPGKPTIGIEVPNSKREVISLRQILESEEFNDNPLHSPSRSARTSTGASKLRRSTPCRTC